MSLRERIRSITADSQVITNDCRPIADRSDKWDLQYRFKPSICEFLKGVRHIADKSSKLERFQTVFIKVESIGAVEDFYNNDADEMFKGGFELIGLMSETVGTFAGKTQYWSIPLSAVEVVK